jgi:hypothetical protein
VRNSSYVQSPALRGHGVWIRVRANIFHYRYTDSQNLKEHASTAAFKQFSKAIGGWLAQAPEIKRAGFVAGFDGRTKAKL